VLVRLHRPRSQFATAFGTLRGTNSAQFCPAESGIRSLSRAWPATPSLFLDWERFLNPSSLGRIRSPIFHERRSATPEGRKFWRNRKERREWARRLQSEDPGLEVVHPQAAGIDVGNSARYVAVRPNRDPEPVRRFECFTADLHRMADWLYSCGVKTVAMQSTAVIAHSFESALFAEKVPLVPSERRSQGC